MQIRPYQPAEEPILHKLFFDTVHNVNNHDYTQQQLDVWAPEDRDMIAWQKKIRSLGPFVCVTNQQIIGYCDLQTSGYIDHFFCHHKHQGKGVGSALMQHIHQLAAQKNIKQLTANVSITAKYFFIAKGFTVVSKQQIRLKQQVLTNYIMKKDLLLKINKHIGS
ncbi:GNAT family N-acetyltransferase [Paraglaciecola sp. L3A3]|uniref:GNAT family N-acetyltransferase n=1 Tax=Paraglaciecola sp. L3A3 TaxID=2686358 RepID=UPI00131DB737|nr:GNAT family N-acetyltransferase [Paraglaciecola sp. L3A3]